jgi:hypothetical protein
MSEEKASGRELGLLVSKLGFISETPLLTTESKAEFEQFSAALGNGLNTQNVVEDMHARHRCSCIGRRECPPEVSKNEPRQVGVPQRDQTPIV